MRHFCAGIGDGNPVSTDPAYGAAAWHGTGLAPGCFLYTTDSTIVAPKLRGIQWTDSGTLWEWYHPVRHGDRLTMTVKLLDAVEKRGSTARAKAEGGRRAEIRAPRRYTAVALDTIAAAIAAEKSGGPQHGCGTRWR